MLWILSLLRALHGFIKALTCRALFPLLLFFAAALSGAACRDDDGDARAATDDAFDDSDASPVAGTIQGSFAVSSTGEATYTLPLVVPPGAAGMQPSLAITYNSASGNGMLGIARGVRSFVREGTAEIVGGITHDTAGPAQLRG